jgi:hypothetical protein
MRLIPHLAWHDLRSQRVPLLVWAGILALLPAAILVGPALLLHMPRTPVLLLLRLLSTGFLAALIVQRDSLVGTTAFWLTRPITRVALFASKLVSLAAVLVVVPWAVTLIAWWSTGALVSDAVRAGTAVAVEQGVVTLLAAMAACITSSLTHLVVAAVASFALVSAAGGVVVPAILRFWPFMTPYGRWQPDVFIVTIFVLGLPIIGYQYIKRRERRSAAMVMVALLTAIAAGLAWPAEPLIRPSGPVDQAVVNPEGVVVSLDPETLIEQYRPEEVGGVVVPRTQLSAVITADGQSDAVLLMATAIDSRLTYSDQTVSDRMTVPIGPVLVPRSSNRKSLAQLPHLARQAALGPSAVLGSPAAAVTPFGRVAVATLPADLADRYRGEPAILDAALTFRAHQYRMRGVIPARPGARFAFPDSAVEITSVSLSPVGAAIGFREAEIRSPLSEPTAFPQYCLRNTPRHEAFLLEAGRTTTVPLTFSRMVTVTTGTWQVRSSSYAFADSRIDAAWLAGAELVRLELEDLGTFTRPLHAEFTLKK